MISQSVDQMAPALAGERWERRRGAALVLRVMSFLIPIVGATLAGVAMGKVLPEPSTGLGVAGWWAAVVATTLIVMKVFDRLGRLLLPMVWLLRMTMAFPDEAPSRLQVVMKSGVVAELRERIQSARADGEPDLANVCRNILALAAALSKHDGTTRSHSERVQAYTDLLGCELGLTESDRDRLRWAALLHDVGKLAVPAEILNKEGAPSESEWTVIRTHPQEGMRIVAPLVPWLGPWARTIEHHHEWFDGTGYPYGLVGEDIALGARIVAVADAYDAITSARAYKKPLSADDARRELAASAGAHFDPRIVRALFNVSLGKLRWIIGPAAWLAQLPFLGGLDRLGRDAAVLLATVVAFLALVVGGGAALPGTIGDDPSAVTEAGAGDGVVAPSVPGSGMTAEPAKGDDAATPIVAARPDTATTVEDKPVAIAVLNNDAGVPLQADGWSLTIVVPPQSGGGEVAGEEVVYTPSPNFDGGDEFTYQVCRSPEVCSQASVFIQVSPVNDAPITASDTGGAHGTNPVTLTPLANDVDPDGDDLTVGTATAGAGSVVVNPNGTVTYIGPAGFSGDDVVTYEACDPSGACSAGTLIVSVAVPDPADPAASPPTTIAIAANQPPTAGGPSLTVAEDLTVSWLPDVGDPDGDALSCLVLSGPINGSATVARDCMSGTYTPWGDFAGPDEFTIVVSDGAAAATAVVSVTVTPVEDVPVATADLAGTPMGTGVHIDVLANDFDPEGDQLQIGSISPLPPHGTAVVNTSGTVTYVPQVGFTGVDSFSYQVCDPGGSCTTGVVTITVG